MRYGHERNENLLKYICIIICVCLDVAYTSKIMKKHKFRTHYYYYYYVLHRTYIQKLNGNINPIHIAYTYRYWKEREKKTKNIFFYVKSKLTKVKYLWSAAVEDRSSSQTLRLNRTIPSLQSRRRFDWLCGGSVSVNHSIDSFLMSFVYILYLMTNDEQQQIRAHVQYHVWKFGRRRDDSVAFTFAFIASFVPFEKPEDYYGRADSSGCEIKNTYFTHILYNWAE